MTNSDSLFEQTVRLECLKLLSGHIHIDCHVDLKLYNDLPFENQVISNLKPLISHSDALFRYVMAGDPITEYVCGVEKP
jgi:hypothetical protein